VSRYQKGKTRKVKTNLDLLEQEIVSGSGICWAVCKSAPHPRQPRQHPTTQFFTGRKFNICLTGGQLHYDWDKITVTWLNHSSFSALTLLVGCQEEHQARQKIECWGTGVVICVECGANDLHMVQLMPLPPHDLLLQ